MLISLPFSLHTTRDRIAFVLYSTGIWSALVSATAVTFMMLYVNSQNVHSVLDPLFVTSTAFSAEQLYERSVQDGISRPSLSTSIVSTSTIVIAVTLSALAVSVLLIFSGYAIRSHRHDVKSKKNNTIQYDRLH